MRGASGIVVKILLRLLSALGSHGVSSVDFPAQMAIGGGRDFGGYSLCEADALNHARLGLTDFGLYRERG